MESKIQSSDKSKFLISSSFSGNGRARAATLSLPSGDVPTPVFMPVGTQAAVKGVLPRDIRDVVSAPIILGNTYHLNLRPGVEVIRKAGGVSSFMNWNGPVLTDSGGFQVFSLSKLRKLSEDGVPVEGAAASDLAHRRVLRGDAGVGRPVPVRDPDRLQQDQRGQSVQAG